MSRLLAQAAVKMVETSGFFFAFWSFSRSSGDEHQTATVTFQHFSHTQVAVQPLTYTHKPICPCTSNYYTCFWFYRDTIPRDVLASTRRAYIYGLVRPGVIERWHLTTILEAEDNALGVRNEEAFSIAFLIGREIE